MRKLGVELAYRDGKLQIGGKRAAVQRFLDVHGAFFDGLDVILRRATPAHPGNGDVEQQPPALMPATQVAPSPPSAPSRSRLPCTDSGVGYLDGYGLAQRARREQAIRLDELCEFQAHPANAPPTDPDVAGVKPGYRRPQQRAAGAGACDGDQGS